MSVVDRIHHYQRNIEKCSDNEDRMLHCITKLSNLPVTVQHLQETGVGRTVNALRKYKNGVGDAAKALVAKWKTMVVNEESSEGEEEDEACVPDAPESYSDSPESPHPEETVMNHRHKSTENKQEQKQKSEKSEAASHSSRHSSKQDSKVKTSDGQENHVDHAKASLSESERRKRHEKSKHTHKHESRSEKRESSSDSKSCPKDAKDNRSALKKDEAGDTKPLSHNLDNVGQSSSKTPDSNREQKSSRPIDENYKKRRIEGISSPKKDTSKRRKNSEGDSDEFKPQPALIKIKEEPKEKDSKSDIKTLTKESLDKSKSSTSKIKSEGSSSKPKELDESYKSKSDKKSSRKDEGHHSKKESSDTKSHSSSSTKNQEKPKDSSKKKDHKHEKSRHDKGKDSADTKRKESKDVKVKQEVAGDEGIDCNSGTSFADALGMCMVPHSSKKRKDNSPNISSSKTMKTEQSSSSSSKKLPMVKSEPDSGDELQAPSLLAPNVKLEPLSVDLASTLPEISPNYKPLPHINSLHRRDEDKALSDVIYVKNQRTKVYSGNKTGYTTVPSLYEICIRVLIENIDALEFTGGVPYDIIKPVLERATPEQLFMLEHYNPYLIEDTDALWKFHCSRKFRNKQREEMESWREMYMRCLDEDEAKLKAITANIKQSADKALPVRSTKLAYVDNVVKPPRNILRKQAKYGTANAVPASTSSLKKKLIAGGGPTAATNISVPPPPMSRIKTSTAVVKKTKAPLMAKALQLVKGRYKR